MNCPLTSYGPYERCALAEATVMLHVSVLLLKDVHSLRFVCRSRPHLLPAELLRALLVIAGASSRTCLLVAGMKHTQVVRSQFDAD